MAHCQDSISPDYKLDDNEPNAAFARVAFIVDKLRVKKTGCCTKKATTNGPVMCDIHERSLRCTVEVKDESGQLTRYLANYKLPLDCVPTESYHKTKNGLVLVYLKKKEVQSWVPHFSRFDEVSVDVNSLAAK